MIKRYLKCLPSNLYYKQPTSTTEYPNFDAFSVTATPSSGLAADITYQWQRSNTNVAVTGWVDIANAGQYSGCNHKSIDSF